MRISSLEPATVSRQMEDFRFSRQRVWRWQPSGILRRVVFLKRRSNSTRLQGGISQKTVIFKQEYNYKLNHRPDDGGSKHLWNVGKLLPDYTAQQPRKQPTSYWLYSQDCLPSMNEMKTSVLPLNSTLKQTEVVKVLSTHLSPTFFRKICRDD
jgi:hypothetical protein